MYNSNHIIQLQQVLFLKSLGFSLEEIKSKLLPVQNSEEFACILEKQKKVLIEQLEYLQKAIDTMEKAVNEIRASEEIGMEKLLVIMNLLRQGNPYSFVISRYFGNEQISHIINKLGFENNCEFKINFQSILKEMMELYQKNADPAGPEGQELASRWWQVVNDFSRGDSELLNTLITAGLDADNWPDETMDLKLATKEFLGPAFAVYFSKQQNMKNKNLEKGI